MALLCKVTLDTIRRLISLYSNTGDIVLTPFMGIGSEVFCAVEMDRVGIGFELKKSYYDQAVKNLENLMVGKKQKKLFPFPLT